MITNILVFAAAVIVLALVSLASYVTGYQAAITRHNKRMDEIENERNMPIVDTDFVAAFESRHRMPNVRRENRHEDWN